MTRGSANNKVDSSIDFFLPVDFGDVSQIGDVWPSLGQYGARERLDFRERHRLPAEWLPRERRRLDAGKDAYIAKAQGDLLTANLQRFPVSGTPKNPTESCRCGNSAARRLSIDLFQIVVFVLWGFAPTALHGYRATLLIAEENKGGARNDTPRYICSLFLFSPEESLKAGSTACGHDIGELVIVGCRTTCLLCCWTTGLLGYRATPLPSYLAIGSQHSPAGRWLLIDILAAPNRAGIIHRDIDGRACSFANMVERFRMGVYCRGFLIPCAGNDLADSFDTAD